MNQVIHNQSDAAQIQAEQWLLPRFHRVMYSLFSAGVAIVVVAALLPVNMQGTLALAQLLSGKYSVAVFAGRYWLFFSILLVALAAAAVGSYALAHRIYIIRQWRVYLHAARNDFRMRLAARAPLHGLGYTAQCLYIAPEKQPAEIALSKLLSTVPQMVITGPGGYGKSVELQKQMIAVIDSISFWDILFHRADLPVYLPIPAYMQTEEDSNIYYTAISGIISSYGSPALAEHVRALTQAGRVILYFDGLDEAPEPMRHEFLNRLGLALHGAESLLRFAITTDDFAYKELEPLSPLLRSLPRAEIHELTPENIKQMVSQAWKIGLIKSSPETPDMLSVIASQRLWPIYANPGLLALALQLAQKGIPCPQSRTDILRQHVATAFSSIGVYDERLDRSQRALGFLAIAFRLTGLIEITGAQAWNERKAVRSLLADSANTSPLGEVGSRALNLNEIQLTEAIDLACMAGILERSRNGQGLRFRSGLVLSYCAARQFNDNDSGFGRMAPALLRREWLEIMIMWGALTDDVPGMAQRLLRLAASPAARRIAAGVNGPALGDELPLALTLMIAANALSGAIRFPERAAFDNLQEITRDICDKMLNFGTTQNEESERRRGAISEALQLCETSSGNELAPALGSIVKAEKANRLLRAQIAQVLGLLASRESLNELTALLLEQDPIVRESLQRGFRYAGSDGARPLLQIVAESEPSSAIHRRAMEALAAIGQPAAEVAAIVAQNNDTALNIAAIEALGVLRGRESYDILVAQMRSANKRTRIAAIYALGKIGDLRAQPALMKFLQTSDDELRIAAIEALGMMRSDKSLESILAALEDRNPKVRAIAAEALGRIGDNRAIDPLRKRLSDRDSWTQAAAATALRALGKR